MSKKHIELLGKTARDRVTGMEGIIESISFDLYGCIQVAVKPPIDKDGKWIDGRWFDVHRLEIINDKRVMRLPEFTADPPKFGDKPETHTHGPAEKPAR